MIKRSTYRTKLFIYFFITFIVFIAAITSFQYKREKQYKEKELESILNDYSEFVNSYMVHNNIVETSNYALIDSFIKIQPRKDIRITVIDMDGVVQYDSYYGKYWEMENHKLRPEVQEALYSGTGSSIRHSKSTRIDYYYYAKLYKNYFVRAAVVYTMSIEEFLKAESIFIYFIILTFIIMILLLVYVSDRMGRSISALKDFAVKAGKNEAIDTRVKFPENELGIIGDQILTIYDNQKRLNAELRNEKEKLIHHLQISMEGIAIFSKTHEKILANNHFIQYLNLISDIPAINPVNVLKVEEMKPIGDFVNTYLSDKVEIFEKNLPIKRLSINKNKLYFEVQCIIFQDKSYEISIIDVTKAERRRILKQQMTSNIAHELRTPVTSIKGYLETILAADDIEPEKQKYFLEKANNQIDRLSELIRDISIITKIEEASPLYTLEDINLEILIKDVIENLQSKVDAVEARIEINVDHDTIIKGNKELVYSIFQNLLENALNYAGEKVTIRIDKYLEDENNVFFSFSDTGVGIDEEHQARVFERFYRIDKGRARKHGGTGLGLAIVKNAVQFHRGDISVKTRKGGGAEFLFSLAK
ncbi:MAG: two-component sensor histidine kinase [Bacteroidales bacterium]|nr:two-component sensor histidine kinase [Bacteroidales bacterium]